MSFGEGGHLISRIGELDDVVRLYENGAIKEAQSALAVILGENYGDPGSRETAGQHAPAVLNLLIEVVGHHRRVLLEKDAKIGELAALLIEKDLVRSVDEKASPKRIEEVLKAGKERETLAVIREICGFFPEQAGVMLKLGEFLVERGEFDKAREVFTQGLLHDGRNAELWSGLSYACDNLGDGENAIHAARMAAQFDTVNPLYQENLLVLTGREESGRIPPTDQTQSANVVVHCPDTRLSRIAGVATPPGTGVDDRCASEGGDKAESGATMSSPPHNLADLFSGNEKTGIVIPALAGWQHLRACLDSVIRFTGGDYEIIVVDNSSTEPVEKFLSGFMKERRQVSWKYVAAEKGAGFAGACNRGIVLSKADCVVLLDSRTLVSPGWLERLTEPFRLYADVGVTAPVSNGGQGVQLIEDCPVSFSTPAKADFGKFVRYSTSHGERQKRRHLQVSFIANICLAVRKEVFFVIGGFDERFDSGGCWNDDFCLRTQISGYRLMVCSDTFIYSFANKVAAAAAGPVAEKRLSENLGLLAAKWQLTRVESKEDVYEQVLTRKDHPADAVIIPVGREGRL